MAEQREDRGFKVIDRRSFDRDGEQRADEPAEAPQAEPSPLPDQPAPPGEAEDQPGSQTEPGDDESLPDVDFVTFVLSLHNSAACLLGAAPYPDTGQCAVNLPMAKQTVDILGMLLEKTKGNLTGEEERILGEVLYDLRLAYVQAVRK